jgi:hypothetical protein
MPRVHAESHRGSGLPVPTAETVFEVTAKGRVHTVHGAKLREWIIRESGKRNGRGIYLQTSDHGTPNFAPPLPLRSPR